MKKQLFFTILILSIIVSCKSHKEIFEPKPMSIYTPSTTSCLLVEKAFINVGGKVTEYKELYLRCSIEDYFIKICEGNVTRKQLEPYLNKGIKVKMEIRNGIWDHCNDNPAYAQSRTGTYAVILKIIE